jgi:uncharacterized protein YndB with AHSA1/START domain
MSEDVEAVIEVAAPRERVWRAVTEPDLVAAWMGCLGFRAYPGAIFYMQPDRTRRAAGDPQGAIVCRVKIMDAPRRIAFGWTFPDNPETEVAIRLRAIPGGTHVKLTHSGWDQFDPEETERVREGLARGWHAVALPALRRVAESAP